MSAKTDAALREQPTVHVTCPVCRKGAALPNGPKSLPINFLVNGLLDALALTEAGVEEQSPNSGKGCTVPPQCEECERATATARCLDCLRYLCAPDHEHHQRAVRTLSHKVVGLSELRELGPTALRRPCLCAEHRDEELRLFCETCDKPICRDCTLVEHAKHRFEFLNKVASKHKAAMQTLLEKANARGPQLQGTIVAVDQAIEAGRNRAAADRLFISQQIAHCIEALKEREVALLGEVNADLQKHETDLNAKKQDLEVALSVVRSGCTFVERALQAGGDAELMAMRGTVTRRMEELIKPAPVEAPLQPVGDTLLPRTDIEEEQKALRQAFGVFGAKAGGAGVVQERNRLKIEVRGLKTQLATQELKVQALTLKLTQQAEEEGKLRQELEKIKRSHQIGRAHV